MHSDTLLGLLAVRTSYSRTFAVRFGDYVAIKMTRGIVKGLLEFLDSSPAEEGERSLTELLDQKGYKVEAAYHQALLGKEKRPVSKIGNEIEEYMQLGGRLLVSSEHCTQLSVPTEVGLEVKRSGDEIYFELEAAEETEECSKNTVGISEQWLLETWAYLATESEFPIVFRRLRSMCLEAAADVAFWSTAFWGRKNMNHHLLYTLSPEDVAPFLASDRRELREVGLSIMSSLEKGVVSRRKG